MSETKQAKLMRTLGTHMAESAGVTPIIEDRYRGFKPGQSAGGEMALDHIMEDENQPRKFYDKESLVAFGEHLKIHGIQSPIQLRWSEGHGKWMIVFGHRRFRAAKIAGFETIPCTFSSDDTGESTIRIRQLVENCQREDLAPMEMARAIEALMKITAWSNRQMGEELGFSHVSIARYRNLLNLPEDLQQKVNSGELALTVAVDVLRLKDQTQQRNIGRDIAEENLSRSQAKKLIDQALESPGVTQRPRTNSDKKQLLTQNANVAIYRNPNANDAKIQNELLAAAALLDPEKSES